ncbi:uncharacterized protein BDR25DRAFT_214686, partial [Lindgomyces ingoldianus]
YANKGRDTLLNSYTKDKFKQLCSKLWTHSADASLSLATVECHFYTLVNLMLGHYMLTRRGNCCSAEILDLFTFKFKGEGPTGFMPLIFTTCASKQN